MSTSSLYDLSQTLMESMRNETRIIDTRRRILRDICEKIELNLIGKNHPQYNEDGTPKNNDKGNQIILHDNPLNWDGVPLTDAEFQKKYDTLKTECDKILKV